MKSGWSAASPSVWLLVIVACILGSAVAQPPVQASKRLVAPASTFAAAFPATLRPALLASDTAPWFTKHPVAGPVNDHSQAQADRL
jgi:hypothetical protein